MGFFKSIKQRDPAARNWLQILLLYPGVKAVIRYRVAHFFYKIKLKFIAQFIMYRVRVKFAIDIHPACKIGKRLFIDHGTAYVLVYLNDEGDQSSEMGATFTGQLIYSSEDGSGNTLTGTFTVAGTTEQEPEE